MQWKIRINPKKSAKILNDEVRLMDMILEAEKTGVRPDTLYFKNPFGGNNLDYSHFKDLQSCRDRWDDVEELILRKNVVMHSYVATVGRNYEGYVKFLKRWKCDRSIISEENFNKWCDEVENRSSEDV